jgi:predicted Zn-dependent peptidase
VKAEILKIAADPGKYIDDESLEKAENRLKSQIAFQRERSVSEARDIGYSYTLEIPAYYHNFLKEMGNIRKKNLTDLAGRIFAGHYLDLRTLPEEQKKTD